MANPVTHFEVLGKDAEALQRFYGEAFGWQMQDVMNGSYYMANPGSEGAINGGVGAVPDGGGSAIPCGLVLPGASAKIAAAFWLPDVRLAEAMY